MKTFEIIVLFATTSNSLTLPLFGSQFIVIPIFNGIVCEPTLTESILHEIFTNKYKKGNHFEEKQRAQHFFDWFDKIFKKLSPDIAINIKQIDCTCTLFTKNLNHKETIPLKN